MSTVNSQISISNQRTIREGVNNLVRLGMDEAREDNSVGYRIGFDLGMGIRMVCFFKVYNTTSVHSPFLSFVLMPIPTRL
jgi:hypothetical protein